MKTVRATLVPLAFAAAALAVAVSPGPAGAEGETSAVKLQGKIKSVAAEKGSFELSAKGATYQVSCYESPSLRAVRAKKLGDLADGAQVHALGKRKEPKDDGYGGKTQAQMSELALLVAATADYKPPPVPAQLPELKWCSGSLAKKGEARYLVDDTLLHADKDRAVVEVAGIDRDALVKGATVCVEATRADEKKPKDVTAGRVYVIGPGVAPGDLKLLLGW